MGRVRGEAPELGAALSPSPDPELALALTLTPTLTLALTLTLTLTRRDPLRAARLSYLLRLPMAHAPHDAGTTYYGTTYYGCTGYMAHAPHESEL